MSANSELTLTETVTLAGDDTLDTIAGKIGVCLAKSENLRITAGQLLAEARRRVEDGEAGGIGWENWCREHVKRSYRDVQRLLAIAKAPDPEEVAVIEREAARTGMARLRATNVSRPEPLPIEPAADPEEPQPSLADHVAAIPTDRIYEALRLLWERLPKDKRSPVIEWFVAEIAAGGAVQEPGSTAEPEPTPVAPDRAKAPPEAATAPEPVAPINAAPMPNTAPSAPPSAAPVAPECNRPDGICGYGGCKSLGKCLHSPSAAARPDRRLPRGAFAPVPEYRA